MFKLLGFLFLLFGITALVVLGIEKLCKVIKKNPPQSLGWFVRGFITSVITVIIVVFILFFN